MSALPPKADMCGALAHVRFGPKADSCTATNNNLFDQKNGAMDPLRYPMPRLVLRRCLFPLDENRVTICGTDIFDRMCRCDRYRPHSAGFGRGCSARRLSVWPKDLACTVVRVINDRRNWMRVKLVVNAFLPNRVNHTKVLVFENDLIDIRVPLVRGWRVLRHGG